MPTDDSYKVTESDYWDSQPEDRWQRILLSDKENTAYEPIDSIDHVAHYPDFSLLIYPWKSSDAATADLRKEVKISAVNPPTFLVHTHDDRSSSLGSVLFYAGLKRIGVDAELHVY